VFNKKKHNKKLIFFWVATLHNALLTRRKKSRNVAQLNLAKSRVTLRGWGTQRVYNVVGVKIFVRRPKSLAQSSTLSQITWPQMGEFQSGAQRVAKRYYDY